MGVHMGGILNSFITIHMHTHTQTYTRIDNSNHNNAVTV